jgi:hypothetical protein
MAKPGNLHGASSSSLKSLSFPSNLTAKRNQPKQSKQSKQAKRWCREIPRVKIAIWQSRMRRGSDVGDEMVNKIPLMFNLIQVAAAEKAQSSMRRLRISVVETVKRSPVKRLLGQMVVLPNAGSAKCLLGL